MRTFRGNSSESFPINKHRIDEEWFCCIKSGSIRVQMNFEEYTIESHHGEEVFFIVHEDHIFHIIDCSPQCELDIFSLSHETIMTLYPYLGSDANAGLFAKDNITSANMGPEVNQMLRLAFQQLSMLERAKTLLERDKMYLHLLVHLYLTFYNGIGKVENKTSPQSFDIINRFYELFSEKESFCHRDTKYFANRLNITVRYLFQICKDETRKSPKDLINEMVISEITHTMLTTKLSLQQIAHMFNFPDQTAFTQFFKRNAGMTPSQFKQKYK